ncbi:hypothetical protein GCM10020331_084850 [Ectobacillus funiculus]
MQNRFSRVRSTYLPYGRQWIDEEDIAAVADVLHGDYLTTGPYISEFEQAVAQYVGAKYAVAFFQMVLQHFMVLVLLLELVKEMK